MDTIPRLPFNYSVEELEEFIAKLPRLSACNRQDVRVYESLLATRKQQRDALSLTTTAGDTNGTD